MTRELSSRQAIFDMPARRFVTSAGGVDLSVEVHGKRAATPLGPAAGPHTQLAQNICLSWLAGGRCIELKTVQRDDHIEVPRPCIDVNHVGFNVEWSQELTIDESLCEYAKGRLLIAMLEHGARLPLDPALVGTLFEVSVGYDLAGISGDKVGGFLRAMRSPAPLFDRLRAELGPDLRPLADVPLPATLVDGVTVSTFHGCPPDEVERIALHLLEQHGVPVTLKLNPTLLGERELCSLLHDQLGYDDLVVPREAFESDARLDDVLPMLRRLDERARALGLSFGAKLTNTLVVENRRGVLGGQPRVYLSGPPLHVLAMHLVRALRRALGPRFALSFSAGINADNFADAVSMGLAPVTVCTDWLKTGGYGRGKRYIEDLVARMQRQGARDVEAFIARGASRDEAVMTATERYVDSVASDPRYACAAERPPKKIGKHLTLFDCVACDKCVPVCPNDANFVIHLGPATIETSRLARHDGRWLVEKTGEIVLGERHQIGHFADMCNECGNCDAPCPEDGGPHHHKPRFFGSLDAFEQRPSQDGFCLVDRRHAVARLGGLSFRATFGDETTLEGPGFVAVVRHGEPAHVETDLDHIDLTPLALLEALRAALYADGEATFINSKEPTP